MRNLSSGLRLQTPDTFVIEPSCAIRSGPEGPTWLHSRGCWWIWVLDFCVFEMQGASMPQIRCSPPNPLPMPMGL